MKADLHKVLELEMRINALEKTVSGLLEQTQKLAGVLNDVWACVKQIDADIMPMRRIGPKPPSGVDWTELTESLKNVAEQQEGK